MKHISVTALILIIAAGLMAVSLHAQDDTATNYYYSYHRADGNRLVTGRGAFPNVMVVDAPLGDTPVWVVAARAGDAPFWVVVTADGALQGFTINDGQVDTVAEISGQVSPQVPPLVMVADGAAQVVAPAADATPFSHAAAVENGMVYVAANGDVVKLDKNGHETARQAARALPDSRLLVNDSGQIALYGGATNQRYTHGIMGDDLEGSTLVVLDSADLSAITQVDLPGENVFEGIAPLWADVDEDGVADLVTTVSNSRGGAALRVYRSDGTILANGEFIGQAFRWRHQLAFGPFGPEGENELVDVLTPHIGGVPEFFRLNGASLTLAAATGGYTSHVINARNLDMGLAGDLNGDGQIELVVTNQARDRVNGLQRVEGGVVEAWSFPLGGGLTTNLAAIDLGENGIALAAGTSNNALRLWLPG